MDTAHELARAVHTRAAASGSPPLFLYFGPGAIWHKTRPHVFWLSLYALLVWALNRWGLAPNVGSGASSLTAVLSMVTGLMVSFRSGSSNDRWSEGRKIWGNVTQATRSFQRTLFFAMTPPAQLHSLSSSGNAKIGPRDPRLDECLALTVGFSYALKHHLRDEAGLLHADLAPLLPPSLPTMSRKSSPPPLPPRKQASEAEREHSAKNTDSHASLSRRALPSQHNRERGDNVPLAVLDGLHAYLNLFRADGVELLDIPAWATCIGILGQLTESLTAAERIRDTPIPLALGVHLQQIVLLYLATIPPSLVGNLGIWIVPVTAIATFTFFGVDRISEELSDPFGYEANDLPLDRFCSDIKREWLELVGEGKEVIEVHKATIQEAEAEAQANNRASRTKND